MQAKEHGLAVVVVLLSVFLAGPGLGCRGERGADQAQGPAGGRRGGDLPAPSQAPQTTRQVVARQPVRVPRELAQTRPIERLPAGEQLLVYNAMGPLVLRVARADGASLAEVEVASGQVLVVDRKAGVKLARGGGTETIVPGPLDEQAEYLLFALPTGGLRQESERSVVRPETPAERQQRLEERQPEQTEPQTQPETRPSGG